MFKVAKFDKNSDADTVCKELFKKSTYFSNKGKKIKKGKIEKNVVKKKDDFKKKTKLKDAFKALKNNLDSVGKTNVKNKKKKLKEKSPQSVKNEKTRPKQELSDAKPKKKKPRKKKNRQAGEKSEDTAVLLTPKKHNFKRKKSSKTANKSQPKLASFPIESVKKKDLRNMSLRERMMMRLKAARFRFLNEQIYSASSQDAQKIFAEDPTAFEAYHEGYRQQVSKWPLNPLDVIITSIQRLPKSHVVADFGCGDAKLAASVQNRVHSFDLVAANERVTACDMAKVPLGNATVDVAVFCLSLMGTNLHQYLAEANRVLKVGGVLKIAEVESRLDDVNEFVEVLKRFNFKNTTKDLSHNLFYFLDFKKEANIANKRKLPTLSLHPCLYKKR